MKKIIYKDFKSAAAGDECEDVVRTPIAVGGLRTLQDGSNGLGGGRRMAPVPKAPPAALKRSDEIYDFGGDVARKVMQLYPADQMHERDSSFYSSIRVLIEITPSEKSPMSLGIGGYYQNLNLNLEPLSLPALRDKKHNMHRIEMTKEHPYIRRHLLSRNNLEAEWGKYNSNMMFTVGFYTIGEGEIYLGKSKLFFPKHHDEMWIYFDISQNHMH